MTVAHACKHTIWQKKYYNNHITFTNVPWEQERWSDKNNGITNVLQTLFEQIQEEPPIFEAEMKGTKLINEEFTDKYYT